MSRSILATKTSYAKIEWDIFLEPFNRLSPFRRPMGTGAVYADDNHAMTIAWNRQQFNNINRNNSHGFNIYRNSPSDPFRTIVWNGSSGGGANLPITVRTPFMRNPDPTGTEADSPVILYDTVDGRNRFLEFSRFRQWNARDCNIIDPYGDGRDAGASASDIAGAGHMIRTHELDPSYGPIRRTLGIALNAQTSPAQLGNWFVWPAKHIDASCGGNYACDGPIPYGQLVALPPWVDMSNLGLSSLGMRLVAKFRDYGMYAADNGGRSCRSDQFLPNDIKEDFTASMKIIWPYMRAVLNNESTITQPTCSGGGTPIAPNGAYDA